jgi:hypothetical protein
MYSGTMLSGRWHGWAAWAIVGMVGCGSSSGSGSGDPGAGGSSQLTADLDAFADAYAHSWCDGLAQCCHFWPFHPDVCLETARLRAREGVALATGPTSDLPHLNPAARDTCLAQIRQAVGACADTGYPDAVAPQCDWVFSKGVTPPGGACKSDKDCAPPPDQPPLCLDGTCGLAMTNLQEGAACSSTCMAGDYCSPMTKVCTQRIAIGQPCPYNPTGNDKPCANEGWCSRTSGTLLKPGDMSTLVCVPKNLPVLCFTG